MISEIRISDIFKYNFVHKQHFWMNDINSINDISEWFNEINDSIFYIIISISGICR